MPRRLIGQTDRTGRLKKKKQAGLGAIMRTSAAELSPERQALINQWAADPWSWLIATDPTSPGNPPLIITQDEKDPANPYKPFPTNRPYQRTIAAELLGPKQWIFIDKPRQIMATWEACLLMLHQTIFREGQNGFISKSTREEAEVVMADKMRGPLMRTPAWFQTWAQCTIEPLHVLTCLRSGSKVTAVACNAGERIFRGVTPSIVLIDEAARQDALASMLQAVYANANRVWVITTPSVGNPGAAECKAILTDGDAKMIAAEVAAEEDEPTYSSSWDQR